MKFENALHIGSFCAALLLATAAQGDAFGGFEFTGNGFLTVGAGKMLGGTRAAVLDRQCPCFVADYAEGAAYDGRRSLQWGADSKLGVQGTASLQDTNFSLTTQVVVRGAQGGKVDLEWLYGSYRLTADTTIQFGRKRLPMFYYSDTQDVGFALPWTHLPPQLYGWEATNYNGVNIRHERQWGAWAATFNVLAGNENINDSGYWKIYNGQQSRTHAQWRNIFGGDLSLVNDWFETRLVYIQSETRRQSVTLWDSATQRYVAATDVNLSGQGQRQQIYGIALNMDPGNWIFRSEFLHIYRPGATYMDDAQLVALGHRFGDWQLLGTTSHYRGTAVMAMGGDPLGQESHTNQSVTLRYSLGGSSDVKLQLDSQKDQGGVNWMPAYGNARLLSLSYDRIF